jgi:uncharacterized LabA/DUF88 family protein
MNRVIAYIDGFNLYHGLKEAGWDRYLWLDIQKLAINLLRINQELVFTKYFTSRTIIDDDAKKQRQTTYIEALQTLNYIEVIEGKYHKEPQKCRKCGHVRTELIEKMTDVNIAVELVLDAVKDKYDIALLVTADKDLVPAVKAVRNEFPKKRIVIALPPKRYSDDLIKEANAFLHIGRTQFANSLLPPKVIRQDGFELIPPTTWV